MQTRCPQCNTLFRVTESQLSIADGAVRCGICEHIFNVYESDGTASNNAAHTTESHDESQSHENNLAQKSEADNSTVGDSENPPGLKTDLKTDLNIDDIHESPLFDEDQKDTYNFFEENHDENTDYVVPREFHDSHVSDSPSALSTALWGIGTVFLIAALFIEYVWFNRDQFIHVPEIQAEVDTLCQQFDCANLSLHAPSKIELIARNIYSHPHEKNALMINVTIQNNAAFSQPYPMMKIDFSDIRGNIVASRNFLPEEYSFSGSLRNDNNQELLLPNSSSDLTLEVLDPGAQALTYEFSFL